MKILLVEDERDFRNLLVTFLQLQNFEIIQADDGEEGLKLFKENEIELCILDVMLPKMDGFSLGEKIRGLDSSIPIIFLTARNMKDDRLKGLAIADDYITKPFEVEELILRIQNLKKRKIVDDEVPELRWIWHGRRRAVAFKIEDEDPQRGQSRTGWHSNQIFTLAVILNVARGPLASFPRPNALSHRCPFHWSQVAL